MCYAHNRYSTFSMGSLPEHANITDAKQGIITDDTLQLLDSMKP